MARHGTVRRGVVRRGSVRPGPVRPGGVRPGTVWLGPVRYGEARQGSLKWERQRKKMTPVTSRTPAPTPGFRISSPKGFHVTFANGWTVSVQFGGGNYCANREDRIGYEDADSGRRGSPDAEVGAWGPDCKMIDLGSDTVRGWQTPAAVLALMNAAANGDLAAGNIPPEERSDV